MPRFRKELFEFFKCIINISTYMKYSYDFFPKNMYHSTSIIIMLPISHVDNVWVKVHLSYEYALVITYE